jgi:predicted DNA-binding transcriptional regulator AlpA
MPRLKDESGGPLPFIPRGLSRPLAALYIGVGTTLFDEMVEDGRMPKPKRVNNRTIWDRVELDIAFSDLPTGGRNTLQELLEQSGKV